MSLTGSSFLALSINLDNPPTRVPPSPPLETPSPPSQAILEQRIIQAVQKHLSPEEQQRSLTIHPISKNMLEVTLSNDSIPTICPTNDKKEQGDIQTLLQNAKEHKIDDIKITFKPASNPPASPKLEAGTCTIL